VKKDLTACRRISGFCQRLELRQNYCCVTETHIIKVVELLTSALGHPIKNKN